MSDNETAETQATSEPQPILMMSAEQIQQLLLGMQNQMMQNLNLVQQRSVESPTITTSQTSEAYRGNFAKCSSRFSGPDDDVDAFLDAVNTYKECVGISDVIALRGFTMLLTGNAATWWQGIKDNVQSWEEATDLLKGAYGPRKPNYAIYRELFSTEQDEKMVTEFFVNKARALLSKLTEKPSERTQIDMIYGLLHRKIRKRLPREDVNHFDDLIKRARIIEQNLLEAKRGKEAEPAKLEKPTGTLKKRERARCQFCYKFGHEEAECRKRQRDSKKENLRQSPTTSAEKTSNLTNSISCYGCGTPGVIRSKCNTCNPSKDIGEKKLNHLKFATAVVQTHKRPRPILPIQIKGIQGTALADSGAEACIASQSLYQVLVQEGVEFMEETMTISYADSVPQQKTVLKATVDVTIQNRVIPTTFFVLPHLVKGSTTLLGIDFLEEAHISLCPPQRTWYFADEPEKQFEYMDENQSEEATTNVANVTMHDLREDEGTTLNQHERGQLNELLKQHQDTFKEGGEATPFAEHYIDTGNHIPISLPYYKMSPQKKEFLKNELDRLLQANIIEECESPWAAPVVLVPKPNGKLRLCVDYRRLNAATKGDTYPIPRIEDILHAVKKPNFMSTIDLQAGYWQVSVRESDRDKTCFITNFGTYRFKRMAMGLKNAPATFQRLIDKFRAGLGDGINIFAYLDDMLIVSETFEQHIRDLNKVFERLKYFNLKARRDKCVFARNEVKYLGHILTRDGITVNPDKVSAIRDMPRPQNIKHLKTFLQTCSWYRKFIPNFSKVAEPLSRLTRKNTKWTWTDNEQDAFDKLKNLLTTAPVLNQVDPTKPFTIRTDASDYALGAVLLQGEGPEERPIEYASRLLNPAEKNYSTTEREALAVVYAVEKFRCYIEGSKIRIGTDHQPLRWLLSQKSPTGRLARWALCLQSYDIEVNFTPGKQNVVADTLSRPICSTPETCSVCTVIVDMPVRNATDIRREQLKDSEIGKIIKSLEAPDSDDAVRWSERGYVMTNGVLYRYHTDNEDAQLVVPQHERQQLLQCLHDAPTAGHYGVDRTYNRIAAKYYFTGMRKYISDYISNCVPCQRYKISNLKPAGLLQTPVPGQRFEILAIDLFGPLPETTEGYRWILIVEDTTSKWVELFPLKVASAEACAQVLIKEVFLRFGIPRRLISDNGVQFISAVMQKVTFCLKIKQTFTPLYHPASNPVERKNRDMKIQLSILVGNEHRNWSSYLPMIRFAMNSATTVTGCSPAYVTFGREMRTPTEISHDLRTVVEAENYIPQITPYLKNFSKILSEVQEKIEQAQDDRKKIADKGRRETPQYNPGDLVLVSTHMLSNSEKGVAAKLSTKRDGPYQIQKKISSTAYEIATPDTDVIVGKYHVSDLTPFRKNSNEGDLAPLQGIRRRGRPRKRIITKPVPETRRRRGRPRKLPQQSELKHFRDGQMLQRGSM